MSYKKTKLAIASLLLVSLTACAQKNVNEGPRNVANRDLGAYPRNVSTNDLNRPTNNLNGPTNVSTGDINRPGDLNQPFHNMNVSNQTPWFSSLEMQPMSNGFITINPNSYSTTTPSHLYPETKPIQRGQYWYYSFQPHTVKRNTTLPRNQKTAGVTPPQSQKGTPAPIQSTSGINQTALQVIQLTNVERKKNGLAPLKADTSLSKVAQTKSNDMETKHYFSHTSPTYGSPFDMMRNFGITYSTAGENIAMGQPTAQDVVNAWMNSEGHRKNILNPSYTNIGVGFTSTGNYWSQMFIGK
ncbi:MAG: CAP domain-containing protein [Bacillota bacterium]|nr:CAP domain-containing protein [Bacillota bacterium]